MSTDRLPSFLKMPSGRRMNVTVGILLLVAGVSLGGVDLFFLGRSFSLARSVGLRGWLLLAFLTCVVGFCILAGLRLVRHRPNRYGAVLSPWTYYGLALAFVGVAVVVSILMISKRSFRFLDLVLLTLLLSLFCLGAGRHIHLKERGQRAVRR